MAHSFEVTTSHGRLRTYCVQVEAGLEALTVLAPKAADWRTLGAEVVAHRTLAEQGADAVTRAQAKNRVNDNDWDASFTQGSGLAFLLSGKKKKQDPYATLMKVPARRATSLGYAKATAVGDAVLAGVQRFALPQLTEWALTFKAANDALKLSGEAMTAAEDALAEPRFSKRALVRKLNTLIGVTEAFILTNYPGRSALADAILVPAWERRKGKSTEDEPAVDPDSEDVLGDEDDGES